MMKAAADNLYRGASRRWRRLIPLVERASFDNSQTIHAPKATNTGMRQAPGVARNAVAATGVASKPLTAAKSYKPMPTIKPAKVTTIPPSPAPRRVNVEIAQPPLSAAPTPNRAPPPTDKNDSRQPLDGTAWPTNTHVTMSVTATTHKALRGPRGGLILCNEEYAKAIDKSVFPFAQGGAINHQIAGKALCFKQSATPEFANYAHQIVRNASVLADAMIGAGARVVSGGTENHMFLTDLRSIDEDLSGKEAATLLDEMGITLNRNSIPSDPRSPFVTTGIRIGTAAATTAGMKQEQMVMLGNAIVEILRKRNAPEVLTELRTRVSELAAQFPAYPVDFNGYV